MSTIFQERLPIQDKPATSLMKALVFRGPNQIAVEHVPIPKPGPGEAVIRVTLTTICGTDLHILKGEYPVKPGLVIGHDVRKRASRAARRRDTVEPGRLFRQAVRAFGALCRRAWRPQDCHHALPGRQRAHAQVAGARAARKAGPHTATDAHIFAGRNHRSVSSLR